MLNLSAVPATVVCTTVYETSYTTVYDTILVPQVRKMYFSTNHGTTVLPINQNLIGVSISKARAYKLKAPTACFTCFSKNPFMHFKQLRPVETRQGKTACKPPGTIGTMSK
jgi:hypothetical protein